VTLKLKREARNLLLRKSRLPPEERIKDLEEELIRVVDYAIAMEDRLEELEAIVARLLTRLPHYPKESED
jgi:hypothetical protein